MSQIRFIFLLLQFVTLAFGGSVFPPEFRADFLRISEEVKTKGPLSNKVEQNEALKEVAKKVLHLIQQTSNSSNDLDLNNFAFVLKHIGDYGQHPIEKYSLPKTVLNVKAANVLQKKIIAEISNSLGHKIIPQYGAKDPENFLKDTAEQGLIALQSAPPSFDKDRFEVTAFFLHHIHEHGSEEIKEVPMLNMRRIQELSLEEVNQLKNQIITDLLDRHANQKDPKIFQWNSAGNQENIINSGIPDEIGGMIRRFSDVCSIARLNASSKSLCDNGKNPAIISVSNEGRNRLFKVCNSYLDCKQYCTAEAGPYVLLKPIIKDKEETLQFFQDQHCQEHVSALSVDNEHCDKTLSFLNEFKKLSQLDLDSCFLYSSNVKILAGFLKKNQTLTSLSMQYGILGDESAKQIANSLRQNKTLTQLDLGGNHIHDAGVAHLIWALKDSSITHLGLSGNKIGKKTGKVISQLPRQLTSLDLSATEMGDQGANPLSQFLKQNTSLEILNLSHNQIGPEGTEHLGLALESNRILKHLDLSHNSIGSVGVGHIAHSLETNHVLTDLNLNECEIDDHGAKQLGDALKVNQSLTRLYLWHNKIKTEGADALILGIKNHPSLTEVTLGHNEIGGEGLVHLSEIPSQITRFELYHNNIGDAGAKYIASLLSKNTGVKTLELENCGIGPSGAHSLAEALKTNNTVTRVALSHNVISDEGVRDLAEAFKTNNTVVRVELKGNLIKDEGTGYLAEVLKTNKSITRLELQDNDISEAAAGPLKEGLLSNNTLKSILLYGNSICHYGDDVLRLARHPGLEIGM